MVVDEVMVRAAAKSIEVVLGCGVLMRGRACHLHHAAFDEVFLVKDGHAEDLLNYLL